MTGWTADEIEAELARRAAEEARRDRERADSTGRSEAARAKAVCVHCNQPFVSYSEDDLLCDFCLGDD
jgi:hypothetical protein